MTIRAVYDKDRHAVANIIAKRKDKDVVGFSNMPRNVLCLLRGIETEPDGGYVIERYDYKDYMPEFLSYVAHHNPHYEFWVRATPDGYFVHCIVMQEDEPLGRIEAQDRYEGSCTFTNERIRQDQQRNSYRKTTKLNTAKNIFRQYFYGRTVKECMEAVATDVKMAISSQTHAAKTKTNAALATVSDYAKDRLFHRDATFLQYLSDAGMGGAIETYDKAKENEAVVARVGQNVSNANGYYLMRYGPEYIRFDATIDPTPTKLKPEDLSDEVRMALGLLKVAPNGSFVDGAGFKLDETQFFINSEVQLEFDD
tara:strand:+ start:385 stop:1317 length:933 start_codon:yes stop_codon:yes gene_type:complete